MRRDATWYDTTLHNMSWPDNTLYVMTLMYNVWCTTYDMQRHDMTWHDMIIYAMNWHDTNWTDMTWHDLTWPDMINNTILYHALTCLSLIWDGPRVQLAARRACSSLTSSRGRVTCHVSAPCHLIDFNARQSMLDAVTRTLMATLHVNTSPRAVCPWLRRLACLLQRSTRWHVTS